MKFLTDVHTHSTFSHDGKEDLKTMLAAAQKLGISFYGVSEHFDYDYDRTQMSKEEVASILNADEAEYFHAARHLQEDYEGVMNVLIGAEFGYSEDKKVQDRYKTTYEKYRPDFVVNSVHGKEGKDFARSTFTENKEKAYKDYLALVRKSLDVEYPYDIVGHIGYIARYVPYGDRSLTLRQFGAELDDILLTIVRKDKILEVNSSNKGLEQPTLPSEEIVKRYYELGGRKISFGSDAHFAARIADKRKEVVEMLEKIGFTHITVPCKGEHIKVEL